MRLHLLNEYKTCAAFHNIYFGLIFGLVNSFKTYLRLKTRFVWVENF